MAKKRQYNPGDAANKFVRVLLSDAGELLGGLTDEQWARTLDFFDNRCAYSGEELKEDSAEQDHAIPINMHYCGLHLFGNVVPATKEKNNEKGTQHYRDFVCDPARLQKIEDFMEESGYLEKARPFRELQTYCEAQYETIKALREVTKSYLKGLLADSGCEILATRDSRSPVKDAVLSLIRENPQMENEEVAERVRNELGTRTTRKSVSSIKSNARREGLL